LGTLVVVRPERAEIGMEFLKGGREQGDFWESTVSSPAGSGEESQLPNGFQHCKYSGLLFLTLQ